MADRRPLLRSAGDTSVDEEYYEQGSKASPLSSRGSMHEVVARRASTGDYDREDEGMRRHHDDHDEYDSDEHSDEYERSNSRGKRHTRYHSDGALSDDEDRRRSSRTRPIEERLTLLPSKARFSAATSTKRGMSNKLPRKIPRRIKGRYRRIVADAAEERTGRIAVYCPANEIDLDDLYAHMLQVRQRSGSASSHSSMLQNATLSDPHTFKIGNNKSTILPPVSWNASRRTVPLSPKSQALDLHTRDTIDSPNWQASIFFDVLHLRQRIDNAHATPSEDSSKTAAAAMAASSSAAAVSASDMDVSAAEQEANGGAKTIAAPRPGRRTFSKQQSSRILSDFEEDEYSDTDAGRWKDAVIPRSGHREVFLFGFGCIVCWNWESEDHEMRLVRSLAPFSRRMLDEDAAESASDDMEYFFGSQSRVRNDTIELSSGDPVERLAVSFAIAQSSLLSVYEYRLDQIIERNEHIPITLAREGKIHMSQTAISREIGRLFLERNMINLESDILGTPEFFWHHDEFDPVYRRMCDYMEQDDRLEILNKRLDCVRELLDVLSSQVENQHASKLEWIIIWLILCEVVVQVVWGVL
ncbi:Required for meiotic nuclear division protein 1-like [Hondaea fermentalgiana]|uniref:Required for meiotic nuclear division protein 1-like n=1 Tax=Hondaea fermentalgiana TaxID=2315210 RepID=A0A2R5GKR3_9STRA|nr:Required for meiotic nuclear division protein 1-like [Hondaea fermentalgiana]|eukprot:GBG31225.1 Required for meiotic nuclear division protein 1-like [Hondaea fermentalgiana]